MSETVSNPSADRNEKIANAARVLASSENRIKVFKAVYTGKRKVKTISEIIVLSGVRTKLRAYKEAHRLCSEDIIASAGKVNGEIAYQKKDFYTHNKGKILSLARDQRKLDTFPTRSNPRTVGGTMTFTLPRRAVNVRHITIDDIDSFSRVRKLKNPVSGQPKPIYEKRFKDGLQRILNEPGDFKDWGGETDDLFSTRLRVGGRRLAVSFGLKGRGTKGDLTPKKMGRKGDQIDRLFKSPAVVHIVQYWARIDQSVINQMRNFAIAKSSSSNERIYFGVIDGRDSQRIVEAYANDFNL